MAESGDNDIPVLRTLARWRERARERWQQHGQPLVAAARDRVFGATVDPREELARERVVRVGEAHLRRLLADQIARSRRLVSGELFFETDAIRVHVVLRRWRPVDATVRFRLEVGRQDDDTIEIGIRRLGPTQLDSAHPLMRWLVRLHVWWARRQGEADPFDRLLLRRRGAFRAGDLVFVPVPRAPITALAGKSRVLRRIAAYATISSLTVKPETLEVGFHLGRLAERMADMYVLRHILSESAPLGEPSSRPAPGNR
ncbi:MAG: hypothetical protein ACOY33_07980 [Pseudomonadota bacterium]